MGIPFMPQGNQVPHFPVVAAGSAAPAWTHAAIVTACQC